MHPASGCKFAINQKRNNVTISQYKVIVNFSFLTLPCFSCQVKLLVQVSCQYQYWFGSYDYFCLRRIHQKSRNTPIWVFPNIWGLGKVRDIKFGTNVSNIGLLNAAKWQGYSFYRYLVIMGKPTEGGRREVGGWGVKSQHTHNHFSILHLNIASLNKHIESF